MGNYVGSKIELALYGSGSEIGLDSNRSGSNKGIGFDLTNCGFMLGDGAVIKLASLSKFLSILSALYK